jgi:predicted SprT family Zn-dependent metalloprotease
MNLDAAESMALNLMLTHGLLQKRWTFEFDNAKRRFGRCSYTYMKITLSKHLVWLNGPEQVRDTILHEIAHALAGSKAKHGPVWREWCIKIGAKPERCYDSDEVETPKLKYHAKCGACGKEYERARMVRKERKRSCHCQTHLPWDKRVLLNFQERY